MFATRWIRVPARLNVNPRPGWRRNGSLESIPRQAADFFDPLSFFP